MKKTIIIQKNVPIPTIRKYGGKRASKWDFLKAMSVGDSAIVSTDISTKSCSTVANALWVHTPQQFTQRKTDEGVRIWRVKTGDFYTHTERVNLKKKLAELR